MKTKNVLLVCALLMCTLSAMAQDAAVTAAIEAVPTLWTTIKGIIVGFLGFGALIFVGYKIFSKGR